MEPINEPKKKCPNGTRRSKKTGNCEPIHSKTSPGNKVLANKVLANKVLANTVPANKTSSPIKPRGKSNRCPPGTRKNKKGECIPYKNPTEAITTIVAVAVQGVKPVPGDVVVPVPDDVASPVPDDVVVPNEMLHTEECPPNSIHDKTGKCVSMDEVVNAMKELVGYESDQEENPGIPAQPEAQPSVMPEVPKKTETHDLRKTNLLAREREWAEYRDYQTSTTDDTDAFLYPDKNDPLFSAKLAQHKGFADTRYDGTIHPSIADKADELCKSRFEIMPHQMFVRNFMSAETPYNSLLLYHSLGTGKTCSAISVAEEMRAYIKQSGIRDKIIIVASPNVQGNFRKQLFDESRLERVELTADPEEYTWNIESCVGNTLLREINPANMRNFPREKIVSNIQTLIQQHYVFMGYGQFANYIMDKIRVDKNYTEREARIHEIANIRRHFNNRLVIIDEIHNMRMTDDNKNKETSAAASLLMKVARHSQNMRLLLLTATPMFNSYLEIIWLVNLLNANDKRAVVSAKEIFRSNGEFVEKAVGSGESGEELLRRKLIGYVSYVRGENPYTFPYRIYPARFSPDHAIQNHIYPKLQMNGKPIVDGIQRLPVYTNTLTSTSYQSRVYRSIVHNLTQKSFSTYNAVGEIRNMPTFENMDTFGYTLLQIPLESLNMVYPSPAFLESDPTKNSEQLVASMVGSSGLASVMQYNRQNKTEFEYLPDIQKTYGRIFHKDNLPKYSHKIANICDLVRKSKGIVLIYSQYIDGGVVPVALALEEMGFKRHGRTPLFRQSAAEQLDATTMLPKSQVDAAAFQPASYVMITGDKYLSPDNNKDMRTVVAKTNENGAAVKVILISKAGSEGLDFRNVRQVHILEPWYNESRIEQIIGRGVRNLSHCSLPFSQRNVQIFLHGTVIDDDEAITTEVADMYVYRVAELKSQAIHRVERVLKESAVDCLLNHDQTKMTVKNINQTVDMHLSTGETIAFPIGDAESAVFQCNPGQLAKTADPYTSTYTDTFAASNFQYISSRIRQLFRETSSYTRDQLVRAINIRRINPIEQIFYALSTFAENKHNYVVDSLGRFGYIANKGIYYVFQPLELSDDQISMFERTAPIPYRRSHILLEVPTEYTEETDTMLPNTAVPTTAVPNTTVPTPAATVPNTIVPNASIAESTIVETINDEEQPADEAYAKLLAELTEQFDTTQTPQSVNSTKEWTKHASRVMEHMEHVHFIPEQSLRKYTVYHLVDLLSSPDKLVLLRHLFIDPISNIDAPNAGDTAVESFIRMYFVEKMMTNRAKNRVGIVLVQKDGVQLWMRSINNDNPVWTEGDTYDNDLFVDQFVAKNNVPKQSLFPYVGFFANFKEEGMVFKIKDTTQKRNNVGAKCESAGKSDLIKFINRVIGEDQYTTENTGRTSPSGEIMQVGLSVIVEFLLRHYTDIKRSGKAYFMTPEQAVIGDIAHYSSVR